MSKVSIINPDMWRRPERQAIRRSHGSVTTKGYCDDQNVDYRTSWFRKGHVAERISERLGVVAISTGDIFRANVKRETSLGVEAQKFMDAGDFVPDSLTNRLVRDRLSQSDVEDGFLLDGYPRTTAQVDYLDQNLANGNQKLDVVLQLIASDEELVARS